MNVKSSRFTDTNFSSLVLRMEGELELLTGIGEYDIISTSTVQSPWSSDGKTTITFYGVIFYRARD
jgi:hypothetical protein